MKKCLKCGKLTNNFCRQKRVKDGLEATCKDCKRDMSRAYRKTKAGVLKEIYFGQIQSSKRRGHNIPEYSRKELGDWLYSQKLFNELYNKWVLGGYKKDMKPSVDRLDDSNGYSFNNIQLITWKENRLKYYKDVKNGCAKDRYRKVIQYSLSGKEITEYFSLAEAERKTGISDSNIQNACSDKRPHKTAGGYIWKYKL